MAALDDLLASCAFRNGWSLYLKPGRAPQVRPRGTVNVVELEVAPLTADEIYDMIYGVLSAEQIVEFQTESVLAFKHTIEWPDLWEIVFSGSISQKGGEVSAVFHNLEPTGPPASASGANEPEPDDEGNSPRDHGGESPVFAPVGPRVPVRWGHDAKPLPKDDNCDDNPAAQ